MKTPVRLVLLLCAGLGLLVPAARPEAQADAMPAREFARLKQRIDSLLKQRLHPEPLPVILPNPFRVVNGSMGSLHLDDSEPEVAVENGSSAAPGTKPSEEFPPGSNREALARYAAKLRIGGTVALRGQLQIIINDSPRKEGDIVVLDRDNAMSYLHIVRIRPGELTLRLNDATETIRF